MGVARYLRLARYWLGLGPDPSWARVRQRLARSYLRGHGLEIGALHEPLAVDPGVTVDYVDRFTRAESIARFPELDADRIVEPRHIEDGFALTSIGEASADFVIANHVLEHAADPLRALGSWTRVLRPGGILFVTVPDAAQCFDRGRPLTPLSHFVTDHDLCSRGEHDEFRRRNVEHYVEWLTISVPNQEAQASPPPSPHEVRAQAEELSRNAAEIHFHTFSAASFRALLDHFAAASDRPLRLETIVATREITAVLRRLET